VAEHGAGKYRFVLIHPYGRIMATPSDRMPAFRIQPRAEFLHGAGASGTAGWFKEQLETECGAVLLSVSRLDLHADWQGWRLSADDRHRFVCRAKSRITYEDDGVFTGFVLGKRASKTLSGRIYDKTVEMRRSGAAYWEDMWGAQYESTEPVLRVEFEFGREILGQFGVSSPEEAIEAAGGLWMYATSEWLSLRSPTSDQTRTRWPIASEWLAVQRARIVDEAAGVERTYRGRRRGELEKITRALVGYLTSYAALEGTAGIEDTCERLPYLLRSHGFHSGVSFEERVAGRVREWALL
jgi:hypothetical protein